MANVCNPSTQQTEAGGLFRMKGKFRMHAEFQVSLDY